MTGIARALARQLGGKALNEAAHEKVHLSYLFICFMLLYLNQDKFLIGG